jgi:Fe-S-cluster containining protein
MGCVIDGKHCTMCCRAIWISRDASDRIDSGVGGSDGDFIRKNWLRISPEEAKKINPHFFEKHIPETRLTLEESSFFKCTKVTETGCGVYGERPHVCSGYPLYGLNAADWVLIYKNRIPEYHPECTQWPVIPIKNI